MVLYSKVKSILNLLESPWGPERPHPKKDKDFDDLFSDSQNKLKKIFHHHKDGGRNALLGIIFIIAVLWLMTGFYKVDQGEQATVLRFGKFVRLAMPGLNYHIPEPIEKVIKQKVERIESEEIGFRSSGSTDNVYLQHSAQRNVSEESLMLTGDENLVNVNFVVQWKINNLRDYLFNVYRAKETVKSAAESAMREVIGNTPIAVAQTEGRSIVEDKVLTLLQHILDLYKMGIEVVNVRLLKVEPPAEVIDSFRDVQTARADKEKEINQAQAYQNDIIPRARGEAARIIQDAEAYKQETIAEATGEVSRFNAIYKQYINAKELTRRRLYIEFMEDILSGPNKVIIDSNLENNLLPYLPLPQITNKPLNKVE